MSPLADLPGELYSAILDHVPPDYLQHTVLYLTRALPHAPIALHYMFRCIRITRPEQIVQLLRRLRRRVDDSQYSPASLVHEISVESWTVDADVVLNLLAMLTELKVLKVHVGPSNFTPEHLEELLTFKDGQKKWENLSFLEVRFNPYVQKATYQQFLKGSYFDSTLVALSKWPEASFTTLSIVQEPMDSSLQLPTVKTFAQPIVFFRLDPNISALIHSPALSCLSSFSFQLPSRQITRSLTTRAFPAPNVEFLDVSTCNVLETDIDTILASFIRLKHILVDECAVLRGEFRAGDWASLAKRCALSGDKRAREREKNLKIWLEKVRRDDNAGEAEEEVVVVLPRKGPRKGRRGVSTATISLRDKPVTRTNAASLINIPAPGPSVPIDIPKIRILPPPPSLRSFSTTTSSLVKLDKHPVIREEWERGWAAGIAQLVATRARMFRSLKNGVRIVRFTDDLDDEHLEDLSGDGLSGLVEVDEGYEGWDLSVESHGEESDARGYALGQAPVLCLAGTRQQVLEHEPGCGHEASVGIWETLPPSSVF